MEVLLSSTSHLLGALLVWGLFWQKRFTSTASPLPQSQCKDKQPEMRVRLKCLIQQAEPHGVGNELWPLLVAKQCGQGTTGFLWKPAFSAVTRHSWPSCALTQVVLAACSRSLPNFHGTVACMLLRYNGLQSVSQHFIILIQSSASSSAAMNYTHW